MLDIKLPDGKVIQFKNQIDGFKLVEKISKSLTKAACIMSVDGKLKEILNFDDSTLKLMGIEGRKNVLKKFDIEKMCNSTIAEYRKLIN